MLDIGGWEFLLIAILGIIIIGPKELPGAIRTVSNFVRRARGLARDFQLGLEEVARDAELDTLTDDIKGIAGVGPGNLSEELQDALDPDGNLREAVDYQIDWTDDDPINYEDPEFSDDQRIGSSEYQNEIYEPDETDTADTDTVTAATKVVSSNDSTAETKLSDTGEASVNPEIHKKPAGS